MLIPKVEPRINQYLNFLEKRAYRTITDLSFEVFETSETFRSPPEEGIWNPMETPGPWGKEWTCFWFRTTYQAPPHHGKPLFLSVLPNADSLAFIDGKPYGAFNLYHKKLRIEADGKTHTLHVEAYSGHSHGGCGPFEGSSMVVTIGKTLPAFPNVFEGGRLLERLEGIYGLYYDVRALFETSKQLDQNSLRKAKILQGVYQALMGVSFNAADDDLEAQAIQARTLLKPLLERKNSETTPRIHLAGHAHIDHAWLWHIGETKRKVARTFINMTRFIQEYPEFVFVQSQPCQLEIVKNEYPEVFSAVQEAYRKGNWEPNGGMWVEADCNVISGESLVRQFLVGKGVNKELLGYEADTLWLPDVFGYSAALPQILAGCRVPYFVTSKINWNDTTRFPYETFIWRGIDGTGVKTHFLSTLGGQGYNGRVSPEELAIIWNSVQHKEVQSACVKSVGEGDGGGGTLRGDLEMARRLENLEGAPKAAWKKVSDGLKDVFSTAGDLPEWRGELYLELHRGTYTTQSRTKRNNRRLEFALRSTEFLCAVAALDNQGAYPRKVLLESWKQTLTNQFHDIIPGSSIHRVYAEAEADSARILAQLAELTGKVRGDLLSHGGGALAVNDLSWERRDGVKIPAEAAGKAAALQSAEGEVYPIQRYVDFDGIGQGICTPKLPSLGWSRFRVLTEDLPKSYKSVFKYHDASLETPYYRFQFDPAGRIKSLIDLRQERELVAEGGVFNGFITAEDVPVFWDAWDIDADWKNHITEETRLVSTEVFADGAVCFRLRRTYSLGRGSTLVQDMVCYAQNPRIDFETKVSWQEKWRLLKVGFDTVIDAPQVRCEIQYGHLWRNTHQNLMQDRAQFEVCAHKWISLEESGSGIALLNDCKYGHDVEGGRMRLSLLRAPIAPDPLADQGEHRFTYSILPFAGSFRESGVIQAAYELNVPGTLEFAPTPGNGEAGIDSFCEVEDPGVIVESVKAPENNLSKTLVFRLYESLGGQTQTRLTFSRQLRAAAETDMLEEQPQPCFVSENRLSLEFKPFEIKTLLVTFI